jgi:hypothetical protein
MADAGPALNFGSSWGMKMEMIIALIVTDGTVIEPSDNSTKPALFAPPQPPPLPSARARTPHPMQPEQPRTADA